MFFELFFVECEVCGNTSALTPLSEDQCPACGNREIERVPSALFGKDKEAHEEEEDEE